MKFKTKIIKQICENVIVSTCDPDFIGGRYLLHQQDLMLIADTIGFAIGSEYIIGINHEDGEINIFDQNYEQPKEVVCIPFVECE